MKRSALSAELIRTMLAATIAFLLLSRELTLEEVGVVSAITAALAIIGPIATLGLPFRILRDSARSGVDLNYRNALLTLCVFASPVIGSVCLAVVQSFARTVDFYAIVMLVLAECWLLMSFHLLTSHSLGSATPRALLYSSILTSFPRFAASSVLFLVPNPSVELYAVSLIMLAIPATCASIVLLPRQGAIRLLKFRVLFGDRKAGGLSTTSSLLSRCSDDIDKLLLGSMRGAEEVAIYSVPYRLTFYAMIPGRAFLSSKLAGWYRREGRGVEAELVSVIVAASVAGLVLSSFVFLSWPLLTMFAIGEKFAPAQPLVLAFGAAVIIRGAHYSVGELLFARSAMVGRNVVQVIAVACGVLVMLAAIPSLGVQGAAWATVLMETITLVGYMVLLYAKK